MLRKIAPLALTLPMLALVAPAQASVLTLSDLSTVGNNVGAVDLQSYQTYTNSSGYSTITDYSDTTVLSTEVTLAPTTTTPGLEKVFSTETVKYNYNDLTYKYDEVGASAYTSGSQLNGGKSILLSGSISSSIDTTINFNLSAGGNYLPSSSPFGPSVPALSSLYIGNTLGNITPVQNTTSYTSAPDQSYSVYGNWGYSINISAGQTLSFVAGVYSPDATSVSGFNLNIESGRYDPVTVITPYLSVNKTLVDAHPLPAVPEPATYGMLLAGLGLIGLRRSKRGNAKQV